MISIELWATAAYNKGPQKGLCVVLHGQVALFRKMNVESIKTKSWHVLFKVHIYENVLAGGSLKVIFL